MGFIDKISGKFGLVDNDEMEEKIEEEKMEQPKKPEKRPEPTVIPAFGAIDSNPKAPIDNFVGHNVVDFNSQIASRKSSAPMVKSKINTIRPKTFDQAQEVANSLREKVPVIINFEDTDTETARRIIDFISGTTYAINGDIKKVGQDVFICAPNSVTVTYSEDEKKVSGSVPWLTK
ncbi:MAG: cell division protein SepF [Selenomonadaceae bacterium]|nr:cell division protein SepF [Selenomonadaceae bacterium]